MCIRDSLRVMTAAFRPLKSDSQTKTEVTLLNKGILSRKSFKFMRWAFLKGYSNEQ